MVRLPTSFNFRCPNEPYDSLTSAIKSFRSWVRCLGVGSNILNLVQAIEHVATCSHWFWLSVDSMPTPVSPMDETADIVSTYDRDLVTTVEEKDNNKLWAQLGPDRMHRWVHMLTQNENRWQLIGASTYDVLGHYFKAFNSSLPRFTFGNYLFFSLDSVPVLFSRSASAMTELLYTFVASLAPLR